MAGTNPAMTENDRAAALRLGGYRRQGRRRAALHRRRGGARRDARAAPCEPAAALGMADAARADRPRRVAGAAIQPDRAALAGHPDRVGATRHSISPSSKREIARYLH